MQRLPRLSKWTFRLFLLLVPLALAVFLFPVGCASNPYYDPGKAHHTKQGFRNNQGEGAHNGFFRWQWERLWEEAPQPPPDGWLPRLHKPAAADLAANPAVTWIGHATVLVRAGGLTVLTDPIFSERASPVSFAGPRRIVPPALRAADLPAVDAVLISHNHYDHLDVESVLALSRQPGGPPRFFVPLGVKPWFTRLGIGDVVEMDWWGQHSYRGATFHFTPTQHFSGRTPFDRDSVLWGSWVVASPDFRLFFAGDTGYSPDFKEVGRRLGPMDLALLPIGAYHPRWFMRGVHVNPAEAVRIHQDVGARRSLAMHWGTFILSDEPPSEPPVALAAALKAAGVSPEAFFTLDLGVVHHLPSGPARP